MSKWVVKWDLSVAESQSNFGDQKGAKGENQRPQKTVSGQRMESPVPIPIPPPIASSSRCEGLSSSGVPLDSIPRDIESHHEFVEEWASRLLIGDALRYGVGWEKVPGEEPRE